MEGIADLDPQKLYDLALSKVKTALQGAAFTSLASKAVQTLLPGTNLLQLFNVVQWFAGKASFFVEQASKLATQAENLGNGNTRPVKTAVLEMLVASGVPILQLLGKVTGLDNMVTAVSNSVYGLRNQISVAIAKLATAIKNTLKLPTRQAAPGVVTLLDPNFTVGNITYHLIVTANFNPTTPAVMIVLQTATSSINLTDALKSWTSFAAGNINWVKHEQIGTFADQLTKLVKELNTTLKSVPDLLKKLQKIVNEQKEKDKQAQKGTPAPSLKNPRLAENPLTTLLQQEVTPQLRQSQLQLNDLQGPTEGILKQLQQLGCFLAGTPLLTQYGSLPIEQIERGMLVWARAEDDPQASPRLCVVEETFERVAAVVHLHVGGRVIGTTAEHRVWVKDRGWLAVGLLTPGDLLSSNDGQWIAVEGVHDTGEVLPVYNIRVAECATYFVGDVDWGFSVWRITRIMKSRQQHWTPATKNTWSVRQTFLFKICHWLPVLTCQMRHTRSMTFPSSWRTTRRKGLSIW